MYFALDAVEWKPVCRRLKPLVPLIGYLMAKSISVLVLLDSPPFTLIDTFIRPLWYRNKLIIQWPFGPLNAEFLAERCNCIAKLAIVVICCCLHALGRGGAIACLEWYKVA